MRQPKSLDPDKYVHIVVSSKSIFNIGTTEISKGTWVTNTYILAMRTFARATALDKLGSNLPFAAKYSKVR